RLVPGDRAEAVQKYLKARAARTPRAAAAREAGLADVPATTLLGMERNALTYAGHTVWGVHAERMGGAYVGGSKYRPRSEWTIRRDTHEALITEAEAEAILESLERGGRKG